MSKLIAVGLSLAALGLAILIGALLVEAWSGRFH